ncbi:MAG: helix-turn-helix transcriptional regulator [Gammaproteobacteria bacterium]|jgi:transcriptional regulator with XRE-family HTH domain|nr:helix-turn-helix transcriptional regulator [Gammaproteobacteria bacterium]MBT5223047.1 helix-turn-helix transcriptional regulator [Gammaproteobacteria bacterium]MBT5826293.1 helix-turn-helix transcriptional regulator [Gammaproteobacteria bacterium]MBT5966485.1 helix-turn-helix transcriptional regulator [Gammaproteobacteria bacterium]MBT6420506.1 helix-turn-helix transcriptional regulator [Gammaproteobacteria bacterium]
MKPLLEQLKNRRLALGLKQKDMMLRIGVSRQQYQHLESKGNPRLNTLELIAKGLKSELVLIPTEKLNLVKEILENETLSSPTLKNTASTQSETSILANDPWKNLLGGEE